MLNREAFGECRSIIQRPLDENSWGDLCQVLDSCSEQELKEVLIPYLQPHLEPWPILTRTAPWHWINGLFRGMPTPALELVRTVDLRGRKLREEHLVRLLTAPFIQGLRHLYLQNNRLGIDAMEQIAQTKGLEKISTLALDHNAIFDLGLEQLTHPSSCIKNIDHLFLEKTRITTDGLESLLSQPSAPPMKLLDLSVNRITYQGYSLLAQAPLLKELQTLCVNEPLAPPRTLAALLDDSQGHQFEHLEHLELKRAGVKNLDVEHLAHHPMMDHLRVLDLSWNQLNSSAIRVLAQSSSSQALRVLDLSRNLIDDEGALAILESEHLAHVETLRLEFNNISPKLHTALRESSTHNWVVSM